MPEFSHTSPNIKMEPQTPYFEHSLEPEHPQWTEQDDEDFRVSITNLSDTELITFLESKLQTHPHRDDFSQETVNGILSETFSRFESLPPEEQDVSFPPLITGLSDGIICGTRHDYETDNITDKAWRALGKLAATYPVATFKLEGYIGQDGQMLRPKVLIEGAADLLWRPNVPIYVKSKMLHTMNYLYAFYEQAITPAIIGNLDFENPNKFFRTGIFLDTIKRLHAMSEMETFSERSATPLENALETALHEKKGSYFLMLQTKRTLEEMRSWRADSEFGKHAKILDKYGEAPRKLAPGILGYYDYKNDSLLIGDERESILRPISGADLAFNGSDQKNQDEEAALIHDFTYLSKPDVRQLIAKTIGVDLSKISIPEQTSFLEWAKEQPEVEIDRVKELIHNHGIDGVRTFFSLREEMSGGDTALSLGENLPKETASMLFKKHAELIDAAQNVTAYIRRSFHKEATSAASDSLIQNRLLEKARTLLMEFSLAVYGMKAYGADSMDAAMFLLDKKLNDLKADIELFKNAFRALYEEGVIENFGEVSGVEFGIKSPEELSDENKATMRKMYDENYPESAGYSKEFREVIFHGLEEAFMKKDARFYVLKKDGEMLGYNRFEDLSDTEDGRKRKYVGSFNVSPQYRGSKLGDKIFDDCLAQEISGDTIIEAYADPTLPISSHYLETNGFVATGIEDIGERPLLKIVRDGAMNARLATKKESPDKEELTRLAEEGHISIRKMPRADIPAIASDLLGKGWLLTHITRDAGDKGTVAAVFEKPR